MTNPELGSLIFDDPTLTAQQIEDNLQAECDIVSENERYIKKFTDQELQQEENNLSDITKKIFEQTQKLEDVAGPIKDNIKNLKAEQKLQYQCIKQGGYVANGNVYSFFDHENKMVKMYTNLGELFEVRPMTRSERSASLQIFRNQIEQ
jgi:hypothetical protein